jgi:hypothetical protein
MMRPLLLLAIILVFETYAQATLRRLSQQIRELQALRLLAFIEAGQLLKQANKLRQNTPAPMKRHEPVRVWPAVAYSRALLDRAWASSSRSDARLPVAKPARTGVIAQRPVSSLVLLKEEETAIWLAP